MSRVPSTIGVRTNPGHTTVTPIDRPNKSNSARNASESPRETELLLSVYQHRLLSTRQLRRLHSPATHLRAVQKNLARLRQRGLLASHRPDPYTPTRWYVTTDGADVAEHSGLVQPRSYRPPPELAAGALAAHTLVVNDTGCADSGQWILPTGDLEIALVDREGFMAAVAEMVNGVATDESVTAYRTSFPSG